MARVEKNVDPDNGGADVSKMRGELKKVSRRVNRRHPLLNCFFVVLFFSFIVFLFLAWFLSMTGLVGVPGFSRFTYQQPEPVRIVNSGELIEEIIVNEFDDILTQRLQAGSGTLEHKGVSLTLTEENFTATLQKLLKDEGGSFFADENSQVAIDPEFGIEIFIPISGNSNKTALLSRMNLLIDSGDLETEVTKLQIGSLNLPSKLISGQLQNINLSSVLDQLSGEISRFATIDRIEISKGALTIEGQLLVEVEQL